MILGDKTYLRNFEISVQGDMLNQVRVEYQNKNNKKVKRKKGKNPGNNIYRDLKNKVSITNKKQKSIKEKLELVKDQEEKVHNMEKILNGVKHKYEREIKEGRQKQAKEKIKKILKETKNLTNEYNVVDHSLNGDQNMIFCIDEALKNIYNMKYKLSECKSKLLNIEKYVNRSKDDFESKEQFIKESIDSLDYINEKILVNPLDFVFVEGDLEVGLVISILV
ncbi:hypothetical protein [Paraclostridium sordellii]|uniref:Uncharacterized protein n=1 Tax=Paraclostridium sordellii TaxID=1505 RepID=A0A0C7PAU8_PARSO|nr:hypothetical protein [Paeniclostridium sordellii]QYE96646.1 hypothetical protein KZ987_10285 [Paeniclostridium sordellii]CEN78686.1 Uncharacterised protein [[Clostridium] sordellii] [Paeniclostridium sordellii]CEO09330.1 Uncharacterised protein [[Clostridium] sordellii] [Paeniclostridium sordellii]CEP87511.1 Uncharacterised protein [[Clostridium] sordellii] [Paeniclostridium sordellii]CEP95848.1 Uncharacterised protein [[Clostridium] sordellii] [Paeniclostridium sordellii]